MSSKKMDKQSFVGQEERAIKILALIHTDVCGLFDVQARDDYIYFITFIDNYLQYHFVHLMYWKSDSFEKFNEFKYEIEK